MTNCQNRDPKTVEEWDKFLFSKYGRGLYTFCRALAIIIWDSDPRRLAPSKDLPPSLKKGRAAQYKQIRDIIKGMENLKKRIIRVFAKEPKASGQFEEGKITEREIEFIKEVYRAVREMFQTVDKEIDHYKKVLLGKSLWRKKGHPTDTRNKIAFVFAQVIKKENGEPNWDVIKSLLVWLWKRIKKATYSAELALKCPVFTVETLRSAHYKFFKNPERKSDIEQRAANYLSPLTAKYGRIIEFKKGYINMGIGVGDIESRYPTIVFHDGKILKGMFNLEEAAAFLNVSSSYLKRMCERGFVQYRKSEDEEEMIFSRGELLEWKRGPIKKKPRKAGKIFFDKKAGPAEKPITINLTEEDMIALKKYFELRQNRNPF